MAGDPQMTNIAKAPYGSVCNNCGLCCQRSLCTLAEITFPDAEAPCPALRMGPDGSSCGLVADPASFAPERSAKVGNAALRAAARLSIGAGLGCDAIGDDEDAGAGEDMAMSFKAQCDSLPSHLQRAIPMAISIWLVVPVELPTWMRHAEQDMVAALEALKK